jgi:hypothetical protein
MQTLNNQMSLVPGMGLVPRQSHPGPGYVTGSKGLSVLSPALQDGFRATGFDTQGPWPTRVIDMNEEGDAFARVSPLQGLIGNGAIPTVYRQDYAEQQLSAQQPQIPGTTPSADQTLAAMKQYNQALAAGGIPPAPQPGQFQGDMFRGTAAPQPHGVPPAGGALPLYLYPQDVQRAQEMRKIAQQQQVQRPTQQMYHQPQTAPAPQPQTAPQPLGQTVSDSAASQENDRTVVVYDRAGNQTIGEAEAILLDESELCVTLTLVNPSSGVENLIRSVPLDDQLVVAFNNSIVTNLALTPGQSQLTIKNTKMIVNNSAIDKRYIILAVDQ